MVYHKLLIMVLCLLLVSMQGAYAEVYKLAVQPVISMHDMNRQYTPLLDYLSEQTGQRFLLLKSRNFMSYWNKMKKLKDFDLVLDAAHFTDYRAQRHKYQVLAKIPDTVSFSVVTREDSFILDMEELEGAKIATMPSPGLGAIRLRQMFPNKNKQPKIIKAADSGDAIQKLMDGRADAAIIPTPLVGQYNLNTVTTTDPVPHMAFSISPNMPADMVSKIKNALLSADKTEAGKKMLEKMNIPRFEPSSNNAYKGYMRLLKGASGY